MKLNLDAIYNALIDGRMRIDTVTDDKGRIVYVSIVRNLCTAKHTSGAQCDQTIGHAGPHRFGGVNVYLEWNTNEQPTD